VGTDQRDWSARAWRRTWQRKRAGPATARSGVPEQPGVVPQPGPTGGPRPAVAGARLGPGAAPPVRAGAGPGPAGARLVRAGARLVLAGARPAARSGVRRLGEMAGLAVPGGTLRRAVPAQPARRGPPAPMAPFAAAGRTLPRGQGQAPDRDRGRALARGLGQAPARGPGRGRLMGPEGLVRPGLAPGAAEGLLRAATQPTGPAQAGTGPGAGLGPARPARAGRACAAASRAGRRQAARGSRAGRRRAARGSRAAPDPGRPGTVLTHGLRAAGPAAVGEPRQAVRRPLVRPGPGWAGPTAATNRGPGGRRAVRALGRTGRRAAGRTGRRAAGRTGPGRQLAASGLGRADRLAPGQLGAGRRPVAREPGQLGADSRPAAREAGRIALLRGVRRARPGRPMKAAHGWTSPPRSPRTSSTRPPPRNCARCPRTWLPRWPAA
jgi:hypothetical protein